MAMQSRTGGTGGQQAPPLQQLATRCELHDQEYTALCDKGCVQHDQMRVPDLTEHVDLGAQVIVVNPLLLVHNLLDRQQSISLQAAHQA